jgi:DNA-binding SARP family transcriptional activator
MDARCEKYEGQVERLESQLIDSRKELSELKEANARLQQQMDAIKQLTNQPAIEKATACAMRFLEVYGTQSQLANIVAYRSVDDGDRLNEEDAHPTCILTSKYPNVRVDLRTKLQIEAEAHITKNGNAKNATLLFRQFVQSVFTDSNFWCKSSQKEIYNEHTELIDAITCKFFYSFTFKYHNIL